MLDPLSYFNPNIFGRDLYDAPFARAGKENISFEERKCCFSFPESYKEFLRTRNGFNGDIGKSFVRLYSVEKLSDENYLEWKEFFPKFFRIGDDGGLESYVINYNLSTPAFGLLPHIGDESDFINLGTTWTEFVTRLAKRDFWKESENNRSL